MKKRETWSAVSAIRVRDQSEVLAHVALLDGQALFLSVNSGSVKLTTIKSESVGFLEEPVSSEAIRRMKAGEIVMALVKEPAQFVGMTMNYWMSMLEYENAKALVWSEADEEEAYQVTRAGRKIPVLS